MLQTCAQGYDSIVTRITRRNRIVHLHKHCQEEGMSVADWGADRAGVVSPDLNEQSSSRVCPQLAACRGGEKTLLRLVNLGGRWPEAAPLSLLWTDGEQERKAKRRQALKSCSENPNTEKIQKWKAAWRYSTVFDRAHSDMKMLCLGWNIITLSWHTVNNLDFKRYRRPLRYK